MVKKGSKYYYRVLRYVGETQKDAKKRVEAKRLALKRQSVVK